MADSIKALNVKTSDVAEKLLHLEGSPYSLKEYPMFRNIFNSPMNKVVMRAGRQVSKTITIAANITVKAALSPFSSILYTNASGSQTTSFSNSKLSPFLLRSPVIYANLMKGKDVISNVFSKRFSNFSEVHLQFFSESADRVRGLSASHLYADEVQDVLDSALWVCEEVLSAAKKPKIMYAGTSKSEITVLEYLWGLSTQKEWVLPCSGCKSWNRIDIKNIGLKGLVCKKCDKALNTYEGQWHAFGDLKQIGLMDGYHIPQLILPLHCCNANKWKELLFKREKYSEVKFLNEILGLPSGVGDKLIIEKLPQSESRNEDNCGGSPYIVAGADWSGGGIDNSSSTTLSIIAVYPSKNLYLNIFNKRYQAGEPSKHLKNMAHYIHAFGVNIVYGDLGVGHFAMSSLAELIPSIRVVPVMYSGTDRAIKWVEGSGHFTLGRTKVIDNLILDIKKKRVRCVRWSDFEDVASDFLNVSEELIGEGVGYGAAKRVWRKPPGKRDDFLHSILFAWIAARVYNGDLEFS